MAYHRKTARTLEVLAYIDQFVRDHGFAPTIRQIEDALKFKTTSNVDYHLKILHKEGCIDRGSHQSRTLRVLEQGRQRLDGAAPTPRPQNAVRVQEASAPSPVKVADPIQPFAESKPLSADGKAARGDARPKTRVQKATYVNSSAHLSWTKPSASTRIPVIGPIFAGVATEIQSSDFSVGTYDAESFLDINQGILPNHARSGEMFALEVHGESMIEAGIQDGDYVIVRQTETANNGDMCVIWLDDTNETTLKYFFREEGHIRLQPANATMNPILIEGHRRMRIIGKVVQVVKL